MSLQRYKLTVAYRGTHYHGWQFQWANSLYKGPTPKPGRGIPTIQELLKLAVQTVVQHPVNLVGASRTDSGVHAKGQIAHFDSAAPIPCEGMRRAINSQLPDDILVTQIEKAPSTWDAIFCTTSKRYQYAIWHDRDRNPFIAEYTWHIWQDLDMDAMRLAGQQLIGTHDFASFAHAGHGRANSIRTVLDIDIHERNKLLVFGIEGKGFLWHMIRIIVGTLIQVGMGNISQERIAEMLQAKRRKSSGPTAPAQGLILQWIKSDFNIIKPVYIPPDQNPEDEAEEEETETKE